MSARSWSGFYVAGLSALLVPWRLGHPTFGARLGKLLFTLAIAAGLTPFPAFSDQNELANQSGESAKIETAPVVVDGEILFRVRGASAFPAERRAESIARRIETVARNPDIKPDALQLVDAENRVRIDAGTQNVMSVLDLDTELESIDQRRVLAEVYLVRIAQAIDAYRNDRRPGVLLTHAVYALAATLILLGMLWGLRWTHRRLTALIEQRSKERIAWLESKSYKLLQAEHLWAALQGALKTTRLLLILLAAYLYLNSVLGLFPWTRGLSRDLFDFLVTPLKTMGQGLLGYTPSLLFLAILLIVTRYILKWTRALFEAVGSRNIIFAGFEPEWASPTYRIVKVVIIAFAVVVAYPYIPGSDSGAFKGVTLFLGVLFSLGSSSVLSNVIAGYTMTYRRAFKLGDRVKIGETIGTVSQMRLLVTHLRTPKNEEAVIPNSVILNSEVTNYSSLAADEGLILHTTVGIGYEVPWRQVEAMLIMAAERTPGLVTDRPPFVLQRSLGDFAITYELNVYCDRPNQIMSLYSALHRNILDAFNEYGVAIMTPAYEGDPEQPKFVPKDQWYAAPAQPPAHVGQTST